MEYAAEEPEQVDEMGHDNLGAGGGGEEAEEGLEEEEAASCRNWHDTSSLVCEASPLGAAAPVFCRTGHDTTGQEEGKKKWVASRMEWKTEEVRLMYVLCACVCVPDVCIVCVCVCVRVCIM